MQIRSPVRVHERQASHEKAVSVRAASPLLNLLQSIPTGSSSFVDTQDDRSSACGGMQSELHLRSELRGHAEDVSYSCTLRRPV